MSSIAEKPDEDTPAGFALGVTAYGLWGVIPLFFRLLDGVPLLAILAHRAWWSFVILLATIVVCKRGAAVRAVLANRRACLLLALSTLLIASNWCTYIYAVSIEQVVQAGLGYFITPLANVLLGVLVLGERLRRLQIVALVAAAAGVVVLTIHGGEVPWIAISLVASFSLYGLVRKVVAADALVGLFVETLFLAPAALAYLGYLSATSTGTSTAFVFERDWLLLATGPITTVPLVCFAGAARRLRMTTLGFLQFLTPTMQVAVAIFLFGEPFTASHRWAFPLIWVAVVLYITDAVRTVRQRRINDTQPQP
ncbi:MAG TPA: EamA family transporter RarD [Pirellulales bacterium]|nr:EamA family transporter RarD [Pirellulales bacterium]